MSEKLTLYSNRLSHCCNARQQLVRSREGGFVSQNCERCGTPQRVRLNELPELFCATCDSLLTLTTCPHSRNYAYHCPDCDRLTLLYSQLPYWHERFRRCGLTTPNERGF